MCLWTTPPHDQIIDPAILVAQHRRVGHLDPEHPGARDEHAVVVAGDEALDHVAARLLAVVLTSILLSAPLRMKS
jgi:hypothetical protein